MVDETDGDFRTWHEEEPTSSSPLPVKLYHILDLHPWRWEGIIRVKIMRKYEIKTFPTRGRRSAGHFFNIILKDGDGSIILGTFFGAEATKWFEVLEEQKVYTFDKFQVRLKQPQRIVGQTEFDILCDAWTVISEVDDDIGNPCTFLPSLSSIEDCEKYASVNVIAVVKKIGPIMQPQSDSTSQDSERQKSPYRHIHLCDESNVDVRMTLWSECASEFDSCAPLTTVEIEEARVGHWKGHKQLSSKTGTMIRRDSCRPDADKLRKWAKDNADHYFPPVLVPPPIVPSFVDLRPSKPKAMPLIRKPRICYLTVLEIGTGQNRPLHYNACPHPSCAHTHFATAGKQRCPSCQMDVVPNPRFAFTVKVADFSTSGVVVILGDDAMGKKILGSTAEEWAGEKDNEKKQAQRMAVRGRCFKMTVRMYVDEWKGDCLKERLLATAIEPVDYAKGALFFASKIQKRWPFRPWERDLY
jgi:hypothetical protein